MHQLSVIGNAAKTTTSIELWEMVNQARARSGETEVRRNDFTARCKTELLGEHYETFVVTNANGTESEAISMTRDQCMYVAMRESKMVRRIVTEKLNQAVAPNIDTDEGKLLLIQELATKQLALIHENKQITIERDHAIKTKAQIGDKKVATAMATASAKSREVTKLKALMGQATESASVIAVQGKTVRKDYNWRHLKNYCTAAGLSMGKAFSPGLQMSVNTYPAEAWFEVYRVDLIELFGEVTA